MRRVIGQVQDIWDNEYKDLSIPNEPRAQDSQSQTQRKKGKQKKDKTPESVFDKIHGQLVGLKLGTADDFQSFISAPQEELHGLAPVQWWCLDGQRSRYPELQQMDLDFLSVPPMSDAH
jgi:hypothetical protein